MASRLHNYFRSTIWHGWLRRPYLLYKGTDITAGNRPADAVPVVMLHGLGRSHAVWADLIPSLRDRPYRLLAYDLLGFGRSPKPDVRYSLDDHARAVIASLRRAGLRQPAVLVAHSLGCLVSVRVASLRPDLVRHLVLYEMPLYGGLPDTRRYRWRLKLYFSLYQRIIGYRPIFSGQGRGRAQRLVEHIAGFTLTDDTWIPFIRSLKHSIMEQDINEDLRRLAMPMDVIYGSRDRLVIRGETKLLFGQDKSGLTAHTIREGHRISRRSSRFLAERIAVAASGRTGQEARSGRPAEARISPHGQRPEER